MSAVHMLHEQNYVFTDPQNVQASRLTLVADIHIASNADRLPAF